MEFSDRKLKCIDCGESFLFSAGEQEFFHVKGFVHVPKRCKKCKAARTGKQSTPRETEVLCTECGAATIVPFKPVRNQPVYCRKCFLARQQPS